MTPYKQLRNQRIIYWTGVTLLSTWFGLSGFLEVTKNPAVYTRTLQMGYPPLFIVTLGIAKLIGVIVLLIPRKLNGLKEWVFAAFFFDVVFAIISGYALAGLSETIKPLFAFVLILATYISFRKRYPAIRMSFNN